MRFRILLPIVLFPWLILQAQDVELPDILIENPQQHEERMSWWNDAKFGALITWGVFSTPGKGEWVMWNEQIPVEEYARLADEFNPDPDAMEQWASVAGEAGMKYLVLTTRFCDGFALWPSQSSWRDFTIRKTPARFDPVEKYVAACRNHDLGVGFYYSPGDWRMPGFWFPGLYYDNAEIMKEQGYGQVKELLTEYGKIDIMWWDVGGDESLAMGHAPHEFEIINRLAKRPPDIKYPGPPLWEENKLNAMVRNLQPDIIINNRNQVPGAEWKGDFKTPECRIGEFNTSNDWETCDIFSDGWWGYTRDAKPKSLEYVISTLVQVVTGGGNYMLGIGPGPDGYIEQEYVERLKEVGLWLERYGESIYETRGGPHPNGEWGGFTHRDNILYVHVLDWSKMPEVLPVIDKKIARATCLTGGKVKYKQSKTGLEISVTGQPEDPIDTIIKLELRGN